MQLSSFKNIPEGKQDEKSRLNVLVKRFSQNIYLGQK